MQIISNVIASITGHDLWVTALWLVVAGIVYWVVSWGIGEVKIPEPFNKILRVIAAIAAVGFALFQIIGLAQKA